MENIRVHEQLRRREERDFLTFPRGGKMSNVRRTDTEIGRRRGPHLKLFNHVLRLLLQWLPVCKQRCKDAANVWCGGWVDGKECASSVSCDILVCRRRQTISHWMPGVNMQARVSLMRPGKGIWTRRSDHPIQHFSENEQMGAQKAHNASPTNARSSRIDATVPLMTPASVPSAIAPSSQTTPSPANFPQ